ncbi:MAG TPA: hypothetical protein VJ043_01010, partial [Candidatus Paceibacterota bacterium]|nr:hypothetical protein [Candidatus Paceibacterota bacterium]
MGHKSGFLSVFIVIAVAAAITAGGVVFVLQKRNMMPNEIHETQESSDKMAIAEVSSKDNHAEEVK